MKISTEEVSRIMLAGRLNRTSLVGPKGYGRPVEPRNHTKSRSETTTADAEVARVKGIVDGLPDIREEQVQALKARIESGTYNVSSEDIADLIVRRAWADSMQ